LRISVASGKGGTGKTTVATNLAALLAELGNEVAFLDCDVEEPDGHVFLTPEIATTLKSVVPVPKVNPERCTLCRTCSQICQFHAIAVLNENVLLFPELCHGCGACALSCPEDAIEEVQRGIGIINCGKGRGVRFTEGRLNVGEAMATPLIRAVKEKADGADIVIIDAPPGTSCPVVEAVSDSDFVVLVTEPTPFGLHDLRLAVGVVRKMGLPFGTVVNRAGVGTHEVEEFCRGESVEVLLTIPFDRKIAEAYSRGMLITEHAPQLKRNLHRLYERIADRVPQ
jgi:MinD superfamily P-loop ATPase